MLCRPKHFPWGPCPILHPPASCVLAPFLFFSCSLPPSSSSASPSPHPRQSSCQHDRRITLSTHIRLALSSASPENQQSKTKYRPPSLPQTSTKNGQVSSRFKQINFNHPPTVLARSLALLLFSPPSITNYNPPGRLVSLSLFARLVFASPLFYTHTLSLIILWSANMPASLESSRPIMAPSVRALSAASFSLAHVTVPPGSAK